MGGSKNFTNGRRGLLAAVLLFSMHAAQARAAPSDVPAEAGPEATGAQAEGATPGGSDAPVAVAEAATAADSGAVDGLSPARAPSGVSAPDSGALVAPQAPITAPSESRERAAEPKAKGPSVRVSGRVYARGSADERDDYSRKLGVSEARVGLEARYENVEAEVTADLSSRALLKDAYVRLADDDKRYRLYAGQFKAPFLARELQGSWSLPLIQRGLVEEYLVEDNQLGGRRMGFMGELKAQGPLELRASVGVFRGALDEFGEAASEDVAGRIAIQPFAALTLGASTYLTQAFSGVRNYAGAADAVLELGALSVSAEASAGQLAVGPFLAQTALASYTLPLGKGPWALQPLAGAEWMQLRGAQRAQGHAVLGGLNFLYEDLFKAQFQAERALRPGDEAPGVEVSVQLATRF